MECPHRGAERGHGAVGAGRKAAGREMRRAGDTEPVAPAPGRRRPGPRRSAQAMTFAIASATASMLRLFSAARQMRPVDTA